MADLDAELLALAGDDSSDEETSIPAQIKGSASPPPPSKERQTGDEEGEMARKGTARPVKRRKRAKDDEEEEEEEGELSSSSTHSRKSLHSASMSESDIHGSPPPGGKRGPIFPHEKLFYSAKDKEDILAMPEIQREELLSERAQMVDRHNQDVALRRLLAVRERDEARAAEKKKRKASDDGQRKSSRQKTTLGGRKVGEASDAIEAYKRQREQKGKRDEQRRRDASSKKKDERPASAEGSDVDAHGESEVEWGEESGHLSTSFSKDDLPAELRDFERTRVSRSNFAQYCFYPNFERLMIGCTARINVGPHPETGELVYRLCIIKGFADGKPYAIEGLNGRKFVTRQYVILEHGNSKKDFPFIFCSDAPFTESEFNRFRQTMIVEGFKMPTKVALNKKVNDIHYLINYQLSKDELQEKLKRQGTHDNKMAVFQRIQLQKRRQEAVASGNEAAIADCDAEIARLCPKLAFGTTLVEPKSTEKTQQERLADLNRRNQKLNTENVRKAQLEERRAARRQEAAVARGEALPDRFARVKTRARTHYDTSGNGLVPRKENRGEVSGTITPLTAGGNTPNKATPPCIVTPVALVKDTKPQTGIPKIRYAPNADEILAASLDFEIDIDI
ncbi:RNA polymerase-associated protein rtf1 [Ophidiomyces ophidiicola]|nr:RNA polymerase-associated protein rtf1 [Ophidiomyces ophidiicola]